MLIRTPDAALALAKSRKSVRVINLPVFLYAGCLGYLSPFAKGLPN